MGAVATIGTLAGCIGENPFADGSGGNGTTTETATNTETTTTTVTTTETSTATETGTPTGTGTDTEGIIGTENVRTSESNDSTDSRPVVEPAPKTVDQFLVTNPFYDGNMVVGVSFVGVGAGENDTGFDPAAIKVSTGTEVTWEWTSGDKPHTVESIQQVGTDQPTFDSGEPRQGNNITFRYTFEQPGIYRYVCNVHRDRSGRGAVIVEEGQVGGPGSG